MKLSLVGWPRLMRERIAAAYVDLPVATFVRTVGTEVKPVRIGTGYSAWLRDDIDRWLDGIAARASQPANEPALERPPGPPGLPEDPRTSASHAQGQPPRLRHRVPWNEARAEMLWRELPSCTDRAALLAKINAIPGEGQIPSVEALREKAKYMGLKVPPAISLEARRAALIRGHAAARAADAAVHSDGPKVRGPIPRLAAPLAVDHRNGRPLAEKQQDMRTPRASDCATIEVIRPNLEADDLADGDEKIRAGWNAPQLADWLGCTIAQAETWCRTLREFDAVESEIREATICRK